MKKKELIKRYLLLLIGLTVMTLGIALMVKSDLGTSPISSPPYVFSLKFQSISLGAFSFLWNLILIALEIVLLGRNFRPVQLMQIPLAIVFGAGIDLWLAALFGVVPQNYLSRIIVLLVGCLVLAFGVSLTVLADVVMHCGEAFVKAVAIKTGWEFGVTKVGFDVSLVLLSVICSLLFFREIIGVREGTIIAAVLSGFIVRFFNHRMELPINQWFKT